VDAGGRECLAHARWRGHHPRSRSETVMPIRRGTSRRLHAALVVAMATTTPARAQEQRRLPRPPLAATALADTGRSDRDTTPPRDAGDPIAAATRESRASGTARTGAPGNVLT